MRYNFFDTNNYFIDEKINYLKFENEYQVFDGNGEKIGNIRQRLNTGQKALRIFLNKQMLPFYMEIRNLNDEIQASISRGWTFFMSKIEIKDGSGQTVGIIKQKFRLLKPRFNIFDTSGIKIGEISGDWKAWNFVIKDHMDQEMGIITKKWAGAFKEIFTTADKYNVSLSRGFENEKHKIAVLAAAITIDMVLKENK